MFINKTNNNVTYADFMPRLSSVPWDVASLPSQIASGPLYLTADVLHSCVMKPVQMLAMQAGWGALHLQKGSRASPHPEECVAVNRLLSGAPGSHSLRCRYEGTRPFTLPADEASWLHTPDRRSVLLLLSNRTPRV
ncbi:hypothetical protein NDU88_007619 [Pleurodeles waltl]|uniref:Uncharacterized protein n=1 Tax=Pleurodeles waltl TaxID=8319 RepID=A0AAV7ST90_PLEWA|nr:hypothetical protein NDU88_007619 [Pleurodeles waltl]